MSEQTHGNGGVAPVKHLLPRELGYCALIPHFLTLDECAEFIELSEARGFGSAETDYPPSYRNNDRLVIDDGELAERLYARLRSHAPKRIVDGNDDWEQSGINERMRFCRYRPEQQFSIHQDGVYHRNANCKSLLTFMIYLTDGQHFEGGDTVFYRQGPSVHSPEIIARVRPQAGMLILFDHRIWHAGEIVTAGVKHIMRSDLLFRRTKSMETTAPCEHSGYVWTLATHGDVLASAGRDTAIRLWRPDGSMLRMLEGHTQSVLGLASCGSHYLASVSRDRSLKLWNTESGVCFRSIQAHDAAVLDVVTWQEGVATAAADHSIKLWNKELERQQTLWGHQGWVWGLAQCNDFLASASEDGTAKLWRGGECVKTFRHSKPLRAITALHDGHSVVTGDVDGIVRVWAVNNASEPVQQINAHVAAVRRLRFLTPTLLATAGEDNYVRLWDFTTGALLQELKHENFATDVMLVGGNCWTSSYDGAVKRWVMCSLMNVAAA